MVTAWGAYLIYGYHKLNTPKAEVGFGLMMSVLNVLEGWSFYQPSWIKDSVAANTGLKTLYWMAWWLESREGCQCSKT